MGRARLRRIVSGSTEHRRLRRRLPLTGLLLLSMTGCMVTSSRLDPFPARIGNLHPDGPVVGITRFADTRKNHDQVARLARTFPPPRVLLEEALLVALQDEGVNGLILTTPPDPPRETVVELARDLGLDAVLSARLVQCGEEIKARSFPAPEIRASCSLEVTLRDRKGKVLYSSTGFGAHSARMSFIPDVEAYHRPLFEAMRKVAGDVVDLGFMGAVRRASGETRDGAR